jgi:hypothetical protein
MADNKDTNPAPADITTQDLEARIAELEAGKAAAEERAQKMEASLNAMPDAPKKVTATFKAMVMKDGKPVKAAFGFLDGHVWLRFNQPPGIILPTEIVCRCANGGKATKEEMVKHPSLVQVVTIDGADNGLCKAHLQSLVDMGFGGLVAVAE